MDKHPAVNSARTQKMTHDAKRIAAGLRLVHRYSYCCDAKLPSKRLSLFDFASVAIPREVFWPR
jgi:hypothetical protein